MVLLSTGLFLIYRKLCELKEIAESVEYYINDSRIGFHRRFSDNTEELKKINRKVKELSDVLTIDNPIFGKDSACERKKDNLIKLYANYLVKKEEELSEEDALCKASFVVNRFGSELVLNDVLKKNKFNSECESEREFRTTETFKKEVEEKAKSLTSEDLLEPLYFGINVLQYDKGITLWPSSPHDSTSGEMMYDDFIKNTAILRELEKIGILKKEDDRLSLSGASPFILTESDIDILMEKILNRYNEEEFRWDFIERLDRRINDEHFSPDNLELPFH
jgi:hypothetical protein